MALGPTTGFRRCWIWIVAAGVSAGLIACESEVAKDAPPAVSAGCPTTTEALQTEVLAAACGTNGCHGAIAPALGLDLMSPGLEERLVNASAAGCGEKLLVVPRDAASSYLLQKVLEHEPSCGERMPLGTEMPATEAACIQNWIQSLPAASTPETGGGGGIAAATGGATGNGGGAPIAGGVAAGSGSAVGSNGGTSTGGTQSSATTGGAASSNGGRFGGAGGAPTTVGGTTSGGFVNGGASSSGGSGEAGAATGGNAGSTPPVCGPAVSFASDVQPVLTQNCASAGCHSGRRPSEGLSLVAGESYAALVNQPSASCSGRVLVVPDDLSASYLMDKLLGQNLCSGTRMPKSGSLPAQDLAAISSWICHGALND
jgi:hypothetical protein